MLVALALPQSEAVDLMFAYDLGNLIGHLATTFPQINFRLIAVKQAENGDLLSREEITEGALSQGADLLVFLGDERRFAPAALDQMLVAAMEQYIEKEARAQANKTLTAGYIH